MNIERIQSWKRVGKGGGGAGCRARFTGIKIENSQLTGIKTDFSRITHNSAFDFHGSREINSFFHDSRQLKKRRSRFTESPLSDPLGIKYTTFDFNYPLIILADYTNVQKQLPLTV